jgi:small subunit ribosomal protein S4
MEAKAKYSYGILENNSEVYSKASATKGVTGEVLLQLCEARLDNVVLEWVLLLLEEVLDNLFLTDITVNGDCKYCFTTLNLVMLLKI